MSMLLRTEASMRRLPRPPQATLSSLNANRPDAESIGTSLVLLRTAGA